MSLQSFHWDFTIGARETQRFYRMLVLEKWAKGIAGFGLAGALAAWLYAMSAHLSPAVQALAALGGAAAAMALTTVWLVGYTALKVQGQMRSSGRESYVQETEIDGFGIRVTVGKNRAKLGFERLARVRETRGAFYLFLAGSQAWILPKDQMEAQECRDLRSLLAAVVERGKLRLKRETANGYRQHT